MSQEYYIFDTEQQAIDAEKYICTQAGFPWLKTERWATPMQRQDNGKWVLPVVPVKRALKIFTPAQIDAMITDFEKAHPHKTGFSDNSWFPASHEL
ncbi:MAG: hypothetical protein AAF621_00580 [Pseudomonadota bacterium]